MELTIKDFKENQFIETVDGAYGVVEHVFSDTDAIRVNINGNDGVFTIDSVKRIVCDKPPLAMDFTELAVVDNDVLSLMYDEATTLFEEYDYRYTFDATMTIIDDWNLAKAKLRSILRKHPLWERNAMKPTFEERKQLIRDNGFKSISDLARAMNVDISNLNHIFNTERKPTIQMLFKIANTLQVSIDQVLSYWYYDELQENVRIVNAR